MLRTGAAAALAIGGAIAFKTLSTPAKTTQFYSPSQVGAKIEESNASAAEYDFIIIGGGTASLVLANRLTADGKHTVLVLEAGQSGLLVNESVIPTAFSKLQRTRHDWTYETTPQISLNNRKLPWTRTKLLGGCSSGNALMFHLGAPEDYDRWAELQGGESDAEGWTYKSMKKYFTRFEKFVPHPQVPLEDIAERGTNGFMETGYFGYFTPIGKAFIEACDKVGISPVEDVNTSKGTMGVTRTATYIDSKGRRMSTERAYLTPAVLARPNLKVAVGAQVLKIRFDHSAEQPRAIGVEFAQNKGGPVFFARAKREVILSAGAVNTPQILLLSGIGNAKQLADHNIELVKDLPGVGQHLMDHATTNICYALRPGITTAKRVLKPKTLVDGLMLASAVIQYKLFATGPLTMHSQDCMAFTRVGDGPIGTKVLGRPDMDTIAADSTSGKGAPDVEVVVSSLAWRDHGHKDFDVGNAMSITPIYLRPTSIGEITLRSNDPWDKPLIDPRYYTTRRDIETAIRGIRLADVLARTEPLASMIVFDDTAHPLLDHGLNTKSDAQVEDLIRERTETLYHPTSTARMAPLKDGGVVDTSLRVYGVGGLRIVDASVMPEIVSGHTTGPTIAIAEKASDLILRLSNASLTHKIQNGMFLKALRANAHMSVLTSDLNIFQPVPLSPTTSMRSLLSPDVKAEEVSILDGYQFQTISKPEDILVFEIFETVKDDVMKKIWKLHKVDEIHNTNEVWKLETVNCYQLISYRVEEVPYGVNYYGKVMMNVQEDCVHVRVFRPSEDKGPIKFHSIQTRSSAEGGAVFTLAEPLRRFDY
ncbi:hypothetical protein FRB97_009743 [Tulasnella sp. 331]|nr:hypothetical protein FRB97_009743 [Tulasnella sp. 331]